MVLPQDPVRSSKNAHCRVSFIPSAEDQAPYFGKQNWSAQQPTGSEGVLVDLNPIFPGLSKWSRAFCNISH